MRAVCRPARASFIELPHLVAIPGIACPFTCLLYTSCLAIAVCAVLLCGLAACNGGGDGKKQGKKKVTFWSEVNDSNQTLLTDAIKAFNDAHEDIQVTCLLYTSQQMF